MRRFEGRTVLVTGAAHGIGRAVAHRLAAEGARVAVGDIDDEAGARTATELPDARYVRCDVGDAEAVGTAVASVADGFGGLDVLVNNVGRAGTVWFDDLDEEAWHRQVDPTLLGAVRCIKASLPHLLAAEGGGAVVSIGSVNGLAAFAQPAYSAAKAGLQSLTQNLAVEYGVRHRRALGRDGHVRFTVVAPGTIGTRAWPDRDELARIGDRYPLGRAGRPEDIAAAVAFLASADAEWITGVTLPVDGGLLADGRLFDRGEARD